MSNLVPHRWRPMRVGLYRAIIVGAVALVTIAVSFHGTLDEFAREQVAEAMIENIGIYTALRIMNGVFSWFLTVEVRFLGQIGQMLDPVKDAVERLSSIVMWAMGSLFVQRILLEIAASTVFKWILCSIGVVTTAALLLMEWGRARMWCRQVLGVPDRGIERCTDWLLRMLIIAVVFRFIVPVFIGASFLVSQMFLKSTIEENSRAVSVLETKVSDVASMFSPEMEVSEEKKALQERKAGEEAEMRDLEESKVSDVASTSSPENGSLEEKKALQERKTGEEAEMRDLEESKVSDVASTSSPENGSLEEKKALQEKKIEEEAKMRDLEESRAAAWEEMERLDARIGQLTQEASWRRILPEALGGVSPGDELRTVKDRRREKAREIERIEDAIGESEEALECIDRRIAGEACGTLLDRVSKAGTAGMSQAREVVGDSLDRISKAGTAGMSQAREMVGDSLDRISKVGTAGMSWAKEKLRELNELVTQMTMLLFAVAIKNILFPIVFLMGAVKFCLPIVRLLSRLLCGFERDVRELKDTVTGHIESPGSQPKRLES